MCEFTCTQGTICFELLKGIPAGIAAIIAIVVTVFIARRQHKVDRARLNLDLFEKREPIFHKTWAVLSSASNTALRPNGGSDIEFTNLLPKAKFLFGPEIKTYMELINAKMIELWIIDQNTVSNQNIPQQADNKKRFELNKWFLEEASTGVKEKFAKYLDFGQWT